MASRYPFVGAAAHLFSEKRNKNAVFLHIRERQHSSLFVQIFAVAGNHIFIPSKGLFPVPCRRPVRVPTDQEKLTCNSHQFQESRRFVILIANLFFTSAAFFAPVILSRIRYPTAPVCKNVQSQNQHLKTGIGFLCNGVKTGLFHPAKGTLYITNLYHTSNVHQQFDSWQGYGQSN